MPQTNFEKCAEINALVGNTIHHSLETAKHQAKIIQLEIDEMHESIDTENLERLRDDVGDILFTAYGLGARMGFPVDEDFDAICKSQYTKFDRSAEEAVITARLYLDKGVPTYARKVKDSTGATHYVTFVAEDCVAHNGKRYPKDKWLKSHRFEEPVFGPLPQSSKPTSLRLQEYRLMTQIEQHLAFSNPRRDKDTFFVFGLTDNYENYAFLGSSPELDQLFDQLPGSEDEQEALHQKYLKLVVLKRDFTVVTSMHRELFRNLNDETEAV